MDEIKKLTKAVEEKTVAEIERARVEEEVRKLERARFELVRGNAQILSVNSERIDKLLELISEEVIPAMETQSIRIEVILEIVGIISSWLYSSGYKEAKRLDNLIENISQRGDMKVEIKPSRDANIGDIIEGTKNVGVDIVDVINAVYEQIKKDDVKSAENILNTLPQDAMDIVLAALQSKFAIAKVVVEKIAGKIKLKK